MDIGLKVLLTGVNASWTHSNLALYYLRTLITDLSHEVHILELTLKQPVSEALEIIYQAKPEVLCASVYIWNAEYWKQLIPEVRKLIPKVVIIAGGPEISFNQKSRDAVKPNILIEGCGEAAFRALAERNFACSEKVITGERMPLEQIPFPYTESDKARLHGKMIYYEASRGCACRCSYCLSARDEECEQLPVERVKTDLHKLIALQPKVIKLVDRSFNQNRKWARAIWQEVIKLETDIPFHFEVHPDWLEEEDFQLLSQAPQGRIQFEIGIQSVHPQTLRMANRKSDWNKVKMNLEALRMRTAIPLHTDLIVGLPKEGNDEIRASVDAVLQTYPHELQLGFLKILAGTPLAEKASELGYIWSETAPYQVLQTSELEFDEIRLWEKIAQLINQYWNTGDFSTVWRKAITWREPVQCLFELLELNLGEDRQLHPLSRIKRFEQMAKWLRANRSDFEQQYLLDALNWDWCRKAEEAWYPDFLDGSVALQFRKRHYKAIKEWLQNKYGQQSKLNCSRFIVFSASSGEFSRDYLQGSSNAVFASSRNSENIPVILPSIF